MREPLKFSGTMPANLLPFTAELAIDEVAYRKHLRWPGDGQSPKCRSGTRHNATTDSRLNRS